MLPGEASIKLNEQSLKFGDLYMLKPAIEENNLFDSLGIRNRIALCITDEILAGSKNMPPVEASASAYVQEMRTALRWMLMTGLAYDGLSNDYDRVLDGCAALLLKVYGDRTVLPAVAEALFTRNRKGFYYNDLVWAFFESRYPYGLVLIAARLQSEDIEDVELARRLLGFIPVQNAARGADGEKQYLEALHWIEENNPFLYFTGESFQQTGSPKPYRVVLEAKYLCKAVSVDTGRTIEPLTVKEKNQLAAFKGLSNSSRIMLSEYSLRLHNKNIYLWNEWIQHPVPEQIKAARFWMGGAL